MREEDRRVILASTSPRRLALLQAACFQVDVRRPNADETLSPGSVEEAAMEVARRKLLSICAADGRAADGCTDDGGADDGLVLAADTVVVLADKAMAKPVDRRDAVRMLSALQGRDHLVITAFCMAWRGHRIERAIGTRVWFRKLTSTEIERYVDTGDPMDKAGSYGIQGPGGAFVRQIEGSYTNVMGLPLSEVLQAGERLLAGGGGR